MDAGGRLDHLGAGEPGGLAHMHSLLVYCSVTLHKTIKSRVMSVQSRFMSHKLPQFFFFTLPLGLRLCPGELAGKKYENFIAVTKSYGVEFII